MKKKKKGTPFVKNKTPIETKNQNELSGKTILVVNTGYIKKKFIFQRLRKLGLTILVLNKEKNWAQPYVDEWILVDTANHSESIRAFESFLTNNPKVKIDGVVTFWEDDVLLTAKIVDKFNLIGIPFHVAKQARNKYLFREFCKKNGIRAPKHRLIRTLRDVKEIIDEFEFPLVVKPAYGANSAFVVKVETPEDLTDTYNYIRKNISTNTESALSDGLDVFVEEYIDGDEVDIDILIQNGKIKFYSLSDNYITTGPFFIETGQSIPSSLPDLNQLELVSMAEETLEKLGIFNGCIHYEAKITKNGPVPLEVNLRMGGDEVWSSVKGVWGADLVEGAAKIALGVYLKNDKPALPKRYIAGLYFLTDSSGILSKQFVDQEIKRKSYLVEFHFFKQVGEPVLVPPEGFDYIGEITVSGDNLIDAQDNLKDAKKYFDFEVVKFNSESAMGKTSRKSRFSSAVLNKDLLLRAAKIEHLRRANSENLRNLHVGIACNVYDKDSSSDVEIELTKIGSDIKKALIERGYNVKVFDFNDASKAFRELKESDIDLVFNVCERINNASLLEPHAAALLEILQIPHTGSNYLTLGTCIDKIKVKKILRHHDIPTPKWDYAYSLDDEIDDTLEYPLIVKPANKDHSIGITQASVATSKRELEKQLKHVIENLGSPALIEEYIEGDEYDVTILGSSEDDFKVLPLARTIFNNLPEGYWHIYPYEAKWNGESKAYSRIVTQRPPKNISKRLEALITEIALDTYNILECQDYGRVEIKIDKNGNPHVLELNPNPSLSEDGFVTRAARLVRMNYGDLIEEIIRLSVRRYKTKFSQFKNLNYNLNF
ncbi:hypothetical protein A3G67_03460 [Candidatus Roizmanbacteria bacterium RIFCSPLOWO2_12_FULL_40_12]|uniref:ATP-grasp domain-containing protein n=1 Tax=Candidatus Roizmanbacteria bacterium RIFCSPLOWO2_01_FULL_40_42 TaxID=1802066 RepID=A0A1F7J5J8_9BACT|nr:MAG: hypothetical protein A2779_03095 [Candidatus Roizmanbacteria bacterium RIFCSPHIGHO2_01_FULL_40_98]OGK28328.1 MAG: hypothetical protein A3C31_00460 [Candidatus Roizmanbacteria bacterium RIFCSPHIGHO2_02_FULL_40_53]OGK30564.1 MAG: hypothetical protein A2W49_03145 [Candidatus Roizmanbacteria bacterium RIFCSPHIGHO2_12_41_18]OGK36978.1 MAG: hypothetical protein A3E69_00720 [Candidatus Roizmanbacteria bacterium RIFCSPHIGHO2_12_FULL_40_130]OGK50884.1 MAG: hypothetical protein A3B50_01230 [Candi